MKLPKEPRNIPGKWPLIAVSAVFLAYFAVPVVLHPFSHQKWFTMAFSWFIVLFLTTEYLRLHDRATALSKKLIKLEGEP